MSGRFIKEKIFGVKLRSLVFVCLFILLFDLVLLVLGVIFSSIFLGLRAASLFGGWVALELNMLRFVGLLFLFSLSNIRNTVKYFIIQRVGSSIYLASTLFMFLFSCRAVNISIFSLAIILKMGISPFHS